MSEINSVFRFDFIRKRLNLVFLFAFLEKNENYRLSTAAKNNMFQKTCYILSRKIPLGEMPPGNLSPNINAPQKVAPGKVPPLFFFFYIQNGLFTYACNL